MKFMAENRGMEWIAVGPWECVRGTTLALLEKFIKKVVEAGANEVCYADTFCFSLPCTVQSWGSIFCCSIFYDYFIGQIVRTGHKKQYPSVYDGYLQ